MPTKIHLTYEVPYADTDRMGIIYYANYLVFFERARTRLLDEIGYPYTRLEAEGVGLPVITAHVDYKNSATYGDTLDIYAWLESMSPLRLQVNCEVHCNGDLLASGYTQHVGFDLERRKPRRLPQAFMDILEQTRISKH